MLPREDPAQGWRIVFDVPDHAALHALLERWHEPTRRWLDRPAADLDRVISRTRANDVERMTLHWILHRAQEHEIHHRAQLQHYLRLMGVEPLEI